MGADLTYASTPAGAAPSRPLTTNTSLFPAASLPADTPSEAGTGPESGPTLQTGVRQEASTPPESGVRPEASVPPQAAPAPVPPVSVSPAPAPASTNPYPATPAPAPGQLAATCTAPRQLAFNAGVELDLQDWRQVYSACLGPSRAVQEAVAEQVVRDRDWYVDFDLGTLAFGEDSFPVQFLGSEAADDQTWMWGWHNVNNFPSSIVAIAQHLRQLGHRWGLAELATPSFPLSQELNGHALAAVASVLAPEPVAYYRGPHTGGAVLLAFSDLPAEVFAPVGPQRLASLVSQCLGFPCDHRLLVEGLLCWNGTAYSWQGRSLVASCPQELVFDFDAHWRLTGLSTRQPA